MTAAVRPSLLSRILMACPRLADFRPKFGIPPTVAERSQPKRARPGKEIDTQILERGVQNEKAISRKRSAGRVGLRGTGGIRCRKAGAGTGVCATAAGSRLHL